MNTIRLIGDVHGEYHKYFSLIKKCDNSIQLGDMGFDYSPLRSMVNSEYHRFIPGNHDNYDDLPEHSLGDFGPVPGVKSSFFIRGALSIDKHLRIPRISWWREEELNWRQSEECLDYYENIKPDIVLSHDCPGEVIEANPQWLNPPHPLAKKYPHVHTRHLLSALFSIHQPKLWIFAHYHKSLDCKIGLTRFKCLDIMETFDFVLRI